MPLQNYSMYTRDYVVGELYGPTMTNAVRQSYINSDGSGTPAASAGFGLAVQRVTTEDRMAVIGAAGADADVVLIHGLTMRQLNKEMQTRPGTGNIAYLPGEVMGVLRQGMLTVRNEGGDAVVGANAHVDKTTGAIYAEAGAGRVEAANLVFEKGGAAGDIVIVSLTLAPITPVS